MRLVFSTLFFFNDPSPTEIYTLSLHDALPILRALHHDDRLAQGNKGVRSTGQSNDAKPRDRKSTRLNSSHLGISYAVFCLKKKKKSQKIVLPRKEGHETDPFTTLDESQARKIT